MSQVKAVPAGMHNIIANITLEGCAEALEFWKKAFGAEVVDKAMDPSGSKVWHAAVRIGDSVFFCNDAAPEMGVGALVTRLWLYQEDVDSAFARAVAAGCKVVFPVADMFWGDRMGKVTDKWGNEWTLSQHIKDLTPEEMKRAQDEFVASMHAKK